MCARCRANVSVSKACEVQIVNQINKHIATPCDCALLVYKKMVPVMTGEQVQRVCGHGNPEYMVIR